VQLDEEPEVIPPIPDPLGISSVDLRSIQSFYASGNELLLLNISGGYRKSQPCSVVGGVLPDCTVD
jgi:hypothetical protein